jgi:DNA-binding LacI/PurR family transcriptional regulator
MGSNLLNINSVSPDNYSGAKLATEYLIRNGHQNIAFISPLGTPMDFRCTERIHGWQDTMHLKNLIPGDIIQWHHLKHSEQTI